MNIAFDAKRAFFNYRGLGNYSRDTIRILYSKNKEDRFFLFSPKEKATVSFVIGENCTVEYPIGLWKRFPAVWRSYGISKQLEGMDIFHGLSNELPIRLPKNVRSVLTMHDLIFLQFPELYPFIDRFLYTKKYISSCCRADKIIAISEQTKLDLVRLANVSEEKIEVIYQGCSPIFYSKKTEEELLTVRKKYNLPQEFLLNVGAIERRKNQLFIAQAIRNVDIPLVVVGRATAYLRELEEALRKEKLDHKVIILQNVTVTDLPAMYQMAKVLVYPSLFEGFGIPIVEALVSETPVITSKGGCFSEAGGPFSKYVDCRNTEELTEAINEILSDETVANQMIIEGKKYAERFSDDYISNKIINLYKSLV